MDPITCLSVAGAAVQFLDFSLELVSKGAETYRHGRLPPQIEAENASDDLFSFTTQLERSLYPSGNVLKPVTDNEVALQKLCEECSVIAKELLEKLNRITAQARKGKLWDSFRHALLSVLKAKELSNYEERLSKYRKQIDTRLIRCILSVRLRFLVQQCYTDFSPYL